MMSAEDTKRIEALVDRSNQALLDASRLDRQQRLLTEAIALLRPFAALALICDHFNRGQEVSICSWRIAGDRHQGPTARNCRDAHDFVESFSSGQIEVKSA